MFRKRRVRTVRIFFTSDIHGSDVCFRKFLAAAPAYEANVLLLGGDLTGKGVVPIVGAAGDGYRAPFQGTLRQFSTQAEVAEFEGVVAHNGFYSVRVTDDEYGALKDDSTAQAELFTRVMKEQLRGWMALAQERLAGTDTLCAVMLGNDDEPELAEEIDAATAVVNPEDELVELPGGYQLVSSGYSNVTPWKSPRELDEDALEAKLEDSIAKLGSPAKAIFNFHVPPYNSGLDTVPELDADFRPVVRGGHPSLIPAGSTAVRELILRYQPPLALHGHIHEVRAAQRLGKTLSINPGSDYASGQLDGVIVDLDDEGVMTFVFTRG